MDGENTTRKPVEESFYNKDIFPIVIDTDDMVFEFGKNVVDRLNKEKLLKSLLDKVRGLEMELTATRKAQINAENRGKEFEKSNVLYEKNNRGLSTALQELRAKNTELESEVSRLEKLKDKRTKRS